MTVELFCQAHRAGAGLACDENAREDGLMAERMRLVAAEALRGLPTSEGMSLLAGRRFALDFARRGFLAPCRSDGLAAWPETLFVAGARLRAAKGSRRSHQELHNLVPNALISQVWRSTLRAAPAPKPQSPSVSRPVRHGRRDFRGSEAVKEPGCQAGVAGRPEISLQTIEKIKSAPGFAKVEETGAVQRLLAESSQVARNSVTAMKIAAGVLKAPTNRPAPPPFSPIMAHHRRWLPPKPPFTPRPELVEG